MVFRRTHTYLGDGDSTFRASIPTFTLPKPTKWTMPRSVMNVIMDCLDLQEGYLHNSAALRDEYKSIYEDKEEMRLWLQYQCGVWIKAFGPNSPDRTAWEGRLAVVEALK